MKEILNTIGIVIENNILLLPLFLVILATILTIVQYYKYKKNNYENAHRKLVRGLLWCGGFLVLVLICYGIIYNGMCAIMDCYGGYPIDIPLVKKI